MARTVEITRQQLINFVDQAIENSKEYLSDAAVERLKEVAQITKEVARGDFNGPISNPCGCPMVQAGLATHNGSFTELGLKELIVSEDDSTSGIPDYIFWQSFDRKSAYTAAGTNLLIIVDDA